MNIDRSYKTENKYQKIQNTNQKTKRKKFFPQLLKLG